MGLFVAMGMAISLLGCTGSSPQAANVSASPPKVGESMIDVVNRLGEPESPDFGSQKKKNKYITSYTDTDGTTHHITVENGIITRVAYTDSR